MPIHITNDSSDPIEAYLTYPERRPKSVKVGFVPTAVGHVPLPGPCVNLENEYVNYTPNEPILIPPSQSATVKQTFSFFGLQGSTVKQKFGQHRHRTEVRLVNIRTQATASLPTGFGWIHIMETDENGIQIIRTKSFVFFPWSNGIMMNNLKNRNQDANAE